MQAFIIQIVKHTNPRTGTETVLKMYCTNEQIQAFYDMLGNDRQVVDSKVVLYRPAGIKSYKSVL